MNKTLIGAIVGGIIIFIWQFLSFALVNFHKPAQNYTPKQDAIMTALNSQNLEEGGYIMPGVPEGTSMDDHEKMMKDMEGKPWATVQYHKSYENDMIMNMIRGLLVDIVLVYLFCWLVGRMGMPTAGTIITSAIFTGLIVFFNAPYTGHIWYKTFDIWAHFMDAIVSWGLTGLWLSWWLRRGINENTRFSAAQRKEVD
jgi:hypothetical protein